MSWGSMIWSQIWSYYPSSTTSESYRTRTQELIGIASPIAFLPNCDLVKKDNAQVSVDTAKGSVFILANGLPIAPLGSLIPQLAFEPNDEVTKAVFVHQLRKALRIGSEFLHAIAVERVETSDDTLHYRVKIQDSRLSSKEVTFDVVSSEHGWLMNYKPAA